MKTLFIKLMVVAIILTTSMVLTNCSKNNNSIQENSASLQTNDLKKSLTGEELNMRLIKLNIEFWTRLSSQPLSKIKKVCNENDVKGLVKLINYSDEELTNFMNVSINLSKEINKHVTVKSDCGCVEHVNFDKIYEFVLKIKNNGGALKFFQSFNQINIQNYKSSGPNGDRLAECLAACTLNCLPLTWDPPAWAACMAVCTAACYYITD